MQNCSLEGLLRLQHVRSIRVVTMANPAKRNALSLGMMRALTDTLREVGDDVSASVVVLAADGPVFSAGHDLKELRGAGDDAARELFAACTELMNAVQGIPQPVIAEVQGLATAAGCQLVAACDLAVASEAAAFATPGVKIGLFCSTPMVALSRAVGRKRALEMLLTGRLVSAREAEAWGLVNRVAPAERLRETALELAGEIAKASSATVATGKAAFYEQIDLPQSRAYERMQEVMSENTREADAQEGICAFLEKRAPSWRGRGQSSRQ